MVLPKSADRDLGDPSSDGSMRSSSPNLLSCPEPRQGEYSLGDTFSRWGEGRHHGVQRERGLSLLQTLFSPDASMPGLASRPSPPRDDECGLITDCGPLCLSAIRYGTASDHSRKPWNCNHNQEVSPYPNSLPCELSVVERVESVNPW